MPIVVGNESLDEETDDVGEVVGVVLQQTQVGRPGGGVTLPPPGMKIGGKMGACLFRLSGAKHDTAELHVPGRHQALCFNDIRAFSIESRKSYFTFLGGWARKLSCPKRESL